jgi:hypothetical protein
VDENGLHSGFETGDNGEREITVSFSTVSQVGVHHHPDDAPTLTGTALMRVRGNSSRWFSKSSYRLKLTENGADVKLPLLGMNAGTEWALYGPFLDKTLIRNYMWMNIAGAVMPGWVPNVRFCELMLDGEYRGLYVLMEMIDVQDGRLEMRKYKDGNLAVSYLVRIEPTISEERMVENFSFYTYRMEPGRQVELLYPGAARQTQYVKDYVETNFSEVERMLYAGDSALWKKELDMDSVVNFYILMEYLGVNDTFSASTYFYRDARGKLNIGPVWDFNNVLDNFFQPLPEEGFMLSQRGWFGQLMQDEEFVTRVVSRYRELRRGVLSDEHLMTYIGEVDEWLGSAVERNFDVWGWSFDPLRLSGRERRSPEAGSGQELEDVNPENRQEAMEWMTEYMRERGSWMDEHIDSLYQYCHPSKYAASSVD